MKCLTPKQARFAEEYVLDHNGAAAAVRAGYSARSAKQIANELLTKPDLQAAVQAQEARMAGQLEVDRKRVVSELLKAVEMAREKADPMAMISAWRTIATVCGYFAPERLSVGVQLADAETAGLRRLEAMSDEELAALVDCPT